MLALLILSTLLLAWVQAEGLDCDKSCTHCESCTRRGVQSNVLSYVNGDTSPLLVGYDNDKPWQYQVLNNAWANNGALQGTTFNATTNGPIYISQERVYEVEDCNVLQLTLVAQFMVTQVQPEEAPPLTDGYQNQPYYGTGLFQAADPTTGLVYGFSITNSMVYGLYGRLPTFNSTYASFMYLVPIFERINPQQYNIYQLAFDKAHNSVIYRVDGDDRMLMDVSGKPINSQFLVNSYTTGTEDLVFPKELKVSMGVLQLGLLYPYDTLPGPPCVTLYDYCNCQQNLINLQDQVCTYNPLTLNLRDLVVSMIMYVASFQANRMINIKAVCKCGQESSSDSCSVSDHPPRRRMPSSSSSCTEHCSSELSVW